MSVADLLSLMPFFMLTFALLSVLLIAAFSRDPTSSHKKSFGATLIGLTLAFIQVRFFQPHSRVTELLEFDRSSNFFLAFILALSLVLTLFSYFYFRESISSAQKNSSPPSQRLNEYYVLLLLTTLGSAVLVTNRHFAALFLGMEILSVSLYALISYRLENRQSIEAGIKYLVMAGVSSSFLLFGIALIYASHGELSFLKLKEALDSSSPTYALAALGIAFLLVGLGFKLAWVPFHMASPDIYQGASVPVTALVATLSKGAILVSLLQILMHLKLSPESAPFLLLSLLAILSMLLGNTLALKQNNLKRLLAYSSTAQLGYLLVALLTATPLGTQAMVLYLASYLIALLLILGVMSVLSSSDQDSDEIENYYGLFWRRPFLAILFSTSFLSLAGMPPTAGFIGKLYLIRAAVDSALWTLLTVLLLASAIGFYYSLRVIAALFYPWPLAIDAQSQPYDSSRLSIPYTTLAALFALLLWLGIYPDPVLRLLQNLGTK